MANIPVISMKGICKSFPGVRALQDIELELYKGDVLALMGENGAGKSTLMKVLAGAYQPDAGEILFEGTRVSSMMNFAVPKSTSVFTVATAVPGPM